jgi:hypothetical protein
VSVAQETGKFCGQGFKMFFLPTPETIGKFHSTVLEVEGLLFNILLFSRFALNEIKAMKRGFRRKRGP